MPSDVFGLSVVTDKQVDETWVESPNYGYFAGGNNGSDNVCTIDRIDFSTETVNNPNTGLTQNRGNLAAVSNSNYGYFAGGFAPPYVCTIDRIDFSNEVVAVPPVDGQITSSKSQLAGTYSSDYGYFGGGREPPDYVSTIDRIDFYSETVATPPVGDTLSQKRANLIGFSNPNYGYSYFAGGYDGSSISDRVDRLDFPSETVSLPGNDLPQARGWLAALSSSDYGYLAGGCNVPVFTFPSYYNTIERLDFSNETFSLPGKNLTQKRRQLSGSSNLNYGYFVGGSISTPPSPTIYSTIDRIDFFNDTTSVSGGNLTPGRDVLAAVNSGAKLSARSRRPGFDVDSRPIGSTNGYFAGGFAPPYVCTIDRLDFSTETIAGPPIHSANLREARQYLAAVSNFNYGYFGGGQAPALNYHDAIDRIDFSNETVSEPGSTLIEARHSLAAVSNSNYGYFGGGASSSYANTIDRLDFSNETPSASGNNLIQKKSALTAVSSSNYGYFAGGFDPTGSPPIVNTIDRLDFSNETVMAPGNNLTDERVRLTAVSNSNYGYFAGGQAPPIVNTIERLDFSNETASNPVDLENLTEARQNLAAVSNSNYGYFAGGFAPPYVNTIDRLDFSNETVSASSNNLTEAREGLAAVSGGWATAESQGPKTIPTTPEPQPEPEPVSSQMTFKYYGYGLNIGDLTVHWAPGPPTSNTISAALPFTADGATVTSISGQTHPGPGQAWKSATVDLSPLSPSTGHFVFKYRTGTSFRGDFQLDDMEFTHSGGTDDLDPDLKRTGGTDNWQRWNAGPPATYNTSFFTNVTVSTSTAGGWNYDPGGTPSGSTGTTSDSDGSPTGYYIYAETSSPNYPQKYMWLRTASPYTI